MRCPLTCAQLVAELRDRYFPTSKSASKDILEPTATNLFLLDYLVMRNFSIVQTQALQVQLELGLSLLVVLGERWCARLVQMNSVITQDDRSLPIFCTSCPTPPRPLCRWGTSGAC